MECASRRGALLDRPGSEDLSRRQSPHQTVSVLGMADPRGSEWPSRCDLPGRSLHAAEADEGARQTRLYAILHLLHVAYAEVGDRAISERTHRLPGARILSAEFLRKHARHPPLPPAERRTLDVQVARCTCWYPVIDLRHL